MTKRYIHFKLSKLIRDGLPEIYEKLGHKAELRHLLGDELHAALTTKITEEALELPLPGPTNAQEQLSELGDVLQALQDTAAARGFKMENVEKARATKFAQKGGFAGGIYAETIAVPEDDEEWLSYFRSSPDRFQELDGGLTDSVTFITGNQDKADFLARSLGVKLTHKKIELDELQSFSLREITEHKARQAYAAIKGPVLVEDVALTCHALGRLPGTFIKWFLHELSLQQICDLLPDDNRVATAAVCYCLFDGSTLKFFDGEVSGMITTAPRGDNGFGFDPIFIPTGQSQTYGEMSDAGIRRYSLRTSTVYPEIAAYLSNKTS